MYFLHLYMHLVHIGKFQSKKSWEPKLKAAFQWSKDSALRLNEKNQFCISYLWLYNKWPQIKWLKKIHLLSHNSRRSEVWEWLNWVLCLISQDASHAWVLIQNLAWGRIHFPNHISWAAPSSLRLEEWQHPFFAGCPPEVDVSSKSSPILPCQVGFLNTGTCFPTFSR